MTILDKLQERPTYAQRASDFGRSVVAEMDCQPTGRGRQHTPDANEEFELSAKIAVTFWANNAQRANARRIAERVLLQRLYGDTLALLGEAEKAVFDGDAKAVLCIINTIRSKLVGD